jgi:ABC-type antimicrobial peptide transport system permease subunit
MGFRNDYEGAVGEKLNSGWGGGDKRIIGVMENFETASLNTPLVDQARYIILIRQPNAYYSIQFKIASTSNIKATMDHYKQTWEIVYPEYVFDYDFYNEQLQEEYEYEQRVSDLMRIFSVISILIGCLGLYGLISFVAINKTKEIGIRKVLGASVTNILGLFTKEIVWLMGIAFVIASPLAYYALDGWLNTYAHHISISMEYFAVSFLVTMLIAMITISHRTINSAFMNPAETLKDE